MHMRGRQVSRRSDGHEWVAAEFLKGLGRRRYGLHRRFTGIGSFDSVFSNRRRCRGVRGLVGAPVRTEGREGHAH